MSTASAPWYAINSIDELDTPALVFYPDRIRENISILKSFVDDVSRLRPHVKTHKCTEVSRLMLDAGISKFKCATIAEAEMLAISQAPDVLLAYQPVPAKLHRFIQLVNHYPATTFSCLIDNVNTAQMIAAKAQKAGTQISVFIDVNIGMNRTGILPAGVLNLYRETAGLAGINIKGLHAYDGHIYEPDLQKRTRQCHAAFEPVQQLISQIVDAGYNTPAVVAGGTPTFPVFAQMPGVECSPGTFILWDEGYRALFADLPFLPAALIISRVISVLDDDTVCLDMGHKAIAAENELDKRVIFMNAPGVHFVGHSEEHLVIKTIQKNQFKIGDVLYGLPVHVCPTVNLYDRAHTVLNSCIAAQWKIIARDRTINI